MEMWHWSPVEWTHGIRRGLLTVLVAAFVAFATLTGCYGSFPLTHMVYTVNGEIRPSLLRQIAFWTFTIFPVYGIAGLGDVVVLNLIEFWTGADFGGFDQTASSEGLDFYMEPGRNRRTAKVTISRDGRAVASARFVRVSDNLCEVRSSGGRLLGTAVRTENGELRLENSDGTPVTVLPADEFQALLNSAR